MEKKAIAFLKKYYLPYSVEEKPLESDVQNALQVGMYVPNSEMSHDEMITEIKQLSERIQLEDVAKAFLYSLSSGDTRYRTALSSLVWAKALPQHTAEIKAHYSHEYCAICRGAHGLRGRETIDWNKQGVFRFLPPSQYGNKPDYICAEYVLNDLREFEKLESVSPTDADYDILNQIFVAVKAMKSHNMDTALATEVHKRKLLNTTGKGVHCLLGVLSICGILESEEHKGFLHKFSYGFESWEYRSGLTFYPLFFWRGKNGVNYDAVKEVFGNFCGDKLNEEKAVGSEETAPVITPKKTESKAKKYYANQDYCVMLTNEERKYLALDDMDPTWEKEVSYSVTYNLIKRTAFYYDKNTIVKVVYEEVDKKRGNVQSYYTEYDTHLETDNRRLLLPLTEKGRPKPVTPTNVMAVMPFGAKCWIGLEEGDSRIAVRNDRNNQELAMGEEERIKAIRNDKEFHEFMQYYMATCPEDYFERITEIRTMEHQTVKFEAGDIFRCQIDREHYAYGIILGKTRQIEKWKEFPKHHSFKTLMTQPLIIRIYDWVTTERDITAERLEGVTLLPPVICSDNNIIWGTHKIVAHKELEPDMVQFPLQLARQIKRDEHMTLGTSEMYLEGPFRKLQAAKPKIETLYVEWGLASFEMSWEEVPEEIRQMLKNMSYYNGGVNLHIDADWYINRRPKEEIVPRAFHDLHLPEFASEFKMVMKFLGLPENSTVDDFAEKYGGISRKRYIELLKERC